jgi:hypothetical protein
MNESTTALEAEILRLESLLLHADPARNPGLPEELLSGEFEEIGSSGGVTGRAQVIAWLNTRKKEDRWEFTEFRIRILTTDLVLASYRAIKMGSAGKTSGGSRRSSIWRRSDNRWRMVFHQATKVLVD